MQNVHRFFPELEGIRGVAALLVLLNHVGVYTGVIGSQLFGQPGNAIWAPVLSVAEVGLPIFFVLSGVLLYRPHALGTISGTPRPAAGPYFWRRALRILPAYWVLTVVALVTLNRDAVHGVWEVVRPLLLLQVYEHNVIPAGMGQTWSLATEVAFYLSLPVLAWLLHRWASKAEDAPARTRRIVVPLLGFVVFGFGFAVYTHLPSMGPYPAQHLWPLEWVGFLAIGMILAALSASAEVSQQVWAPYRIAMARPGLCWAGAGVVFLVACSPLTGPHTIDYATMPVALTVQALYLLFTLLLIAPLTAPFQRERLVEVTLANPVMRFLGRISYGVFLWHVVYLEYYYRWTGGQPGSGGFWPVLGAVLALTIVTALVSYVAVERPAMKFRPRLGNAPEAPGVSGIFQQART